MENEEIMTLLEEMGDDVPAMPESVHSAWVDKLNMVPPQEKTKVRQWPKVLAVAAAAVFLIGGTLATRDSLPGAKKTSSAATYSVTPGTVYSATDSAVAGGDSYAVKAAYRSAEATYETYDASEASEAADYSMNAAYAAGDTAVDTSRKIIRNVSISMSVRNYADVMESIRAMTESAGGYIASSSESQSYSGLHTARMEIRLPAGNAEDAVSQFAALGRVTRRSESADDVTDSYRDNESRLQTQKALLARMTELLAKAEDLSDMLEIESRIADTQANIDYYTRLLLRTDDQVNYMTLSMTISEESTAEVATSSPSVWERIRYGFENGVESFSSFLQDLLVFIVTVLPYAAAIAVITVIVKKLIKRRRK